MLTKTPPLILEGPDNIGKTTAAQTLVKMTGWSYHHMTKPPDEWDYHHDYLARIQPERIWDRFHLGGWVYGELLQLHRTKYTQHTLKSLIAELRKLGARTILMFAHNFSWFEDHIDANPKEEMFSRENVIAANARYRSMANYRFADIIWDVSDRGFPSQRDMENWL